MKADLRMIRECEKCGVCFIPKIEDEEGSFIEFSCPLCKKKQSEY